MCVSMCVCENFRIFFWWSSFWDQYKKIFERFFIYKIFCKNFLFIYIRLLAERSNTKSNVKWCGFRSQFQASYTEELWFNEIICMWMKIYIYSVHIYIFPTYIYIFCLYIFFLFTYLYIYIYIYIYYSIPIFLNIGGVKKKWCHLYINKYFTNSHLGKKW